MKLHFHLIAAIVAALRDVFADGRQADRVIEFNFKQHRKWGARDRKLFAESVYEIVRWRRWLWHLAGLPDADHARAEAQTEKNLWHLWSAYWVDRGEFLPPFPECSGFKPFQVASLQKAKVSRAMRASIPDWLDALGDGELGPRWPGLLDALNQPADVFLRANALRCTTAELKKRLAEDDIRADQITGLPGALRLAERRNVFNTQAFRDGLLEVQDAGSQRIAPFLDVEPGMRVIDGCAGAGGKALHLACLMKNKGRILALDVHERKLAELRKRSRRHGCDIIEPRLVEDTKAIKRLHESADRVLLDVPCSGLGVLRRNPDAKWRLSPGEIERLRVLQADILKNYARMTKPGGRLVYATCSILPSENERQIEAFLAANQESWRLLDELRLTPDEDGTDGFYAAKLERLKTEQAPVSEAKAA